MNDFSKSEKSVEDNPLHIKPSPLKIILFFCILIFTVRYFIRKQNEEKDHAPKRLKAIDVSSFILKNV